MNTPRILAVALVACSAFAMAAPASANSPVEQGLGYLQLDLSVIDQAAPLHDGGVDNMFGYTGQPVNVLPIQAAMQPPSVDQTKNLHTEFLRIDFN